MNKNWNLVYWKCDKRDLEVEDTSSYSPVDLDLLPNNKYWLLKFYMVSQCIFNVKWTHQT